MKILFRFILFLSLLLIISGAQLSEVKADDKFDFAMQKLARQDHSIGINAIFSPVVKVIGTFTGSGFVALHNDELIIVAPSHLLQHNSSGLYIEAPNYSYLTGERLSPFELQPRKAFRFKGHIIKDNALLDLAIIKPEAIANEDQSDLTYLRKLAMIEFSNSLLTWGSGYSLIDDWKQYGFLDNVINGSFVDAMLPDRIRLPFLNLQKTNIINDEFISGFYEKIMTVPIYSRLGISGSIVFGTKQVQSMITMIHTDPAPISYAIPITEIAKFVTDDKAFQQLPVASWILKDRQRYLKVSYNGTELLQSFGGPISHAGGETSGAGGETSGAGGETGGAGAETSNDKKKSQHNQFKLSGTIHEDKLENAPFSNPFISKKGSFTIDGSEICAFAITNESDKLVWVTASLPRFLYYQKTNKTFTNVPCTQKRPQQLSYPKPKAIRFYKITNSNKFEIIPLDLLSADPSTLWLDEKDEDSFSRGIEELQKYQNKQFQHQLKSMSRVITKDGWMMSWPLELNFSKTDDSSSLRFRVLHKFDDDIKPNYEIAISNAYQKLKFSELADNYSPSRIVDFNLIPENKQVHNTSWTSESLVTEDRQIQIKNFYQDQDLSKLERTTIKYANEMVEVLYCGKNEGCWR